MLSQTTGQSWLKSQKKLNRHTLLIELVGRFIFDGSTEIPLKNLRLYLGSLQADFS